MASIKKPETNQMIERSTIALQFSFDIASEFISLPNLRTGLYSIHPQMKR